MTDFGLKFSLQVKGPVQSTVFVISSLLQLYQAPKNLEIKQVAVPLLPKMIGDVQTNIVEFNRHTYITKLPTIVELSSRQKRRYDRYRGTKLLQDRNAVLDERFQMLSAALAERKSASVKKRKFNPLIRAHTFI